MKLERVSLLDKNEEGNPEHLCDWCDSIYNKLTETYDKPERTTGYRFGYNTVCSECVEALWEGKTLLDKTKRVKSVEV